MKLGANDGITYDLVRDEQHHVVGFACRKCKRTSAHPMDIKHRYCGCCGVFHDDPGVEDVWAMKERMQARRGG